MRHRTVKARIRIDQETLDEDGVSADGVSEDRVIENRVRVRECVV